MGPTLRSDPTLHTRDAGRFSSDAVLYSTDTPKVLSENMYQVHTYEHRTGRTHYTWRTLFCVHLQQLKLKRRAGGLVQKGQELLLAFLEWYSPASTHTLKLRSSSGDNRKKPDRDSSSVAGPLLGFLAVFRATYCFCARSGACCISNFPSQRPIIHSEKAGVRVHR